MKTYINEQDTLLVGFYLYSCMGIWRGEKEYAYIRESMRRQVIPYKEDGLNDVASDAGSKSRDRLTTLHSLDEANL